MNWHHARYLIFRDDAAHRWTDTADLRHARYVVLCALVVRTAPPPEMHVETAGRIVLERWTIADLVRR